MAALKIAILTMDNREHYKDYSAPEPYFGAAPEALLQGLAQTPGLAVHVVSCTRARMRPAERLASNIFFHSLYVPKLGWMRTAYLGCLRAVRKKLREIGPDIVHGQGTESYCALGAALSGFPNVVTIHGNMARLARVLRQRVGSFFWLSARLEDFTLKRTEGVLCNSEHTERLVKPRARRTWRIPNAVREQFFAPPSGPARGASCTLLNVGVVTPGKRQVELLDVAGALRRQELNFQFLFVGHAPPEDPYAATFLEKIKPMEKEGFVRYLGSKPTRELIRLFDSSAALVHCSVEESFGLVVAEALARNLKVFANGVGGIVDIATGAPEAELFGVEDWSGLTASIAAWIRRGFPQPNDAAPFMRARYHPSLIAQRHAEVYREVLGSSRPEK